MSTAKPKGRLGTAAALATPTGHTEPTKPTKAAAGGRPASQTLKRRLHIFLAKPIAEYLESAWRTQTRPEGSYASGPSRLVEDLNAGHLERVRDQKRPLRDDAVPGQTK